MIVAEGVAFTVTVTMAPAVQPVAVSVTVTVYVVVANGLAVTLAPVALLNPALGLQEKLYGPLPPEALAINNMDPPAHIVDDAGVTVTDGLGWTVKVIAVDAVAHPFFVTVAVIV